MTNSTMSPAKRRDPNYIQVMGDVQKDIGLRFKAVCSLNQLAIGEGLEAAITVWLDELAKQGKSV